MDNHTRECRSICAAQNNRGDDVAHLLKHIVSRRDKLTQIQADSGPEFISTALDHQAYDNQVTLDYLRLGKPPDNEFIESFNGSLQDECLKIHQLMQLEDAQEKF